MGCGGDSRHWYVHSFFKDIVSFFVLSCLPPSPFSSSSSSFAVAVAFALALVSILGSSSVMRCYVPVFGGHFRGVLQGSVHCFFVCSLRKNCPSLLNVVKNPIGYFGSSKSKWQGPISLLIILGDRRSFQWELATGVVYSWGCGVWGCLALIWMVRRHTWAQWWVAGGGGGRTATLYKTFVFLIKNIYRSLKRRFVAV